VDRSECGDEACEFAEANPVFIDAHLLELGKALRQRGQLAHAIRMLNVRATEVAQGELFSILGQLISSPDSTVEEKRGYLRNQIEILYNWPSMGDEVLDRYFQQYMGESFSEPIVHRLSQHIYDAIVHSSDWSSMNRDTDPLLPPPSDQARERRRRRTAWTMRDVCLVGLTVIVALGAVTALIVLLLTLGPRQSAAMIASPCCVNQTVNVCKMGFSARYNQSSDYSAIAYDAGANKILRIATSTGGTHVVFYTSQLDTTMMMVVEEAPLADTLLNGLVYRGVTKLGPEYYVLGDRVLFTMTPSGQLTRTVATLPAGHVYQDLLAIDGGRLYIISDTTRVLELNPVNGAIKRTVPIYGDARHILALVVNRNSTFVLATNQPSGGGAPQFLGRIDLVTGQVRKCFAFEPGYAYGAHGDLWVSGAPSIGGFPSLGVLECPSLIAPVA
jgi:hypothetical protein